MVRETQHLRVLIIDTLRSINKQLSAVTFLIENACACGDNDYPCYFHTLPANRRSCKWCGDEIEANDMMRIKNGPYHIACVADEEAADARAAQEQKEDYGIPY